MRVRLRYAGLALATIGAGLAIHLGGGALQPDVRDVLKDALWAAMIVFWVRALMPRPGVGVVAAVSMGICAAVEFGQMVRHPAVRAFRETFVGHLALGNSFDPRDLLAYGAGVSVGAVIVWRIERTA